MYTVVATSSVLVQERAAWYSMCTNLDGLAYELNEKHRAIDEIELR